MTEISQSDRILLHLRLQLEKLKEGKRTNAPGAPSSAGASAAAPLERLRRLAKAGPLDESEAASMLVAVLLSEEFGPAIANDPKFQRLTQQIIEAIERDADASALLRQALSALKKG